MVAKAERWDEAAAIAQTLVLLFPERPEPGSVGRVKPGEELGVAWLKRREFWSS